MLIEKLDSSHFEDFDRHEEVVYAEDRESGLKAIIAVHNTRRGPALGGCRMHDYASRDEAIRDALRLSKGMTYKSALAGLPLGGGKAVILGDPAAGKSKSLMRAIGRFVDSLEGRYITAEDSGICVQDLKFMAMETPFVAGISNKVRSPGDISDGDPSPSTALGVLEGMRAALMHRFGSASLTGIKVAVQGVGHVGANLVRLLVKEGAEVIISDINSQALEEPVDQHGVRAVAPEAILQQEVDLLAPCAFGGVISKEALEVIRAPIIAGAANNQLSCQSVGRLLKERGKLYAPDYVINAGGIIDIHFERVGYDYTQVLEKIKQIGTTLSQIFTLSESCKRSTQEIADDLAGKQGQIYA